MADYTAKQIGDRIAADPEMQDLLKNDETEFDSRAADIYNEFGYNPDGTPHSVAMRGIRKVSDATGIPKDIVQGAANVPIPMATTIAGGIGGSVLGPGGTLAGASAGSVAGEVLNYKLGLRDKPGAVDLGFAAGAPAIGPILSRMKPGLSNIAQVMPGAAKTMNQVAAATVAKQAQHMEVTDDMVNFMRQNLGAVQPFKVDVPTVRGYIQQELDSVQKSLTNKYKTIKGTNMQVATDPYIEKLKTTLDNMKDRKSFSFDELMATEKSFIAMGAEDPNGIWRKMSGVLVNDLEQQAMKPGLNPATKAKILAGADAYKNFVAVNQRKQAQSSLQSFLEPGHGVITQLDDGIVKFDKQAFLKKIDSEGMKVFEPTEIADMKKAVSNLGYIDQVKMATISGAVHTGSYGAAGLGAYAVGGVAGVVTLAAVMSAIKIGLSTEAGRKAIAYIAKNGHGKIDGAELTGMIGKITAGANSGTIAGVSGMGTTAPPGVKPFANQE